MLYVSQQDQIRIERRVKRLPEFLRDERASIIIFQAVSTLILTYGICISIYLHPIKDKIPDPGSDVYISCFFYFAISVSAPFTGGHMNPAVSIALHWLKQNKNLTTYLIAQGIGSFCGALLAFFFFDVNPAPYTENPYFLQWIADFLAQVGGTFIFVFFILYVTQTNYSSGQYYGYLIISIMLLIGRTFTFRKGCLNPIIGFVFQIIYVVDKGHPLYLIWSLAIVAGPICGGILAQLAFTKFYQPLLKEMENEKLIDANAE